MGSERSPGGGGMRETEIRNGNADTRSTRHKAYGTGTSAAGTGDKRHSTTQGERSRHVHT
eukprot:1256858-Prymnesium_polylepis.2